MKTVLKETEIEFEEKKSKFIGYIKPINSIREAENFIKTIKEMHSNATHNCSAYRIIENGQEYYKFDDDGEPSGTAGKPIGEILTTLGVFNVVVVVTRYFGGIKLGAGGLIRNYAKTAKLAVNESGIVDYIEKKIYLIDFSYSKSSEIDRFINENRIEVLEKTFEERVSYKMSLSNIETEKIKEINDIVFIEL
ncbi:MAG: YigZ family protein [Fusobacteriaceae bacterium]|nr:YigZ family protein [Fusobacteriaceae bacterium]MBN2838570.1 YigZ family protein [Fusobacteriaceae bacterium]